MNIMFSGLGFDKVAELLIRKGANVNVAGSDNDTALIWCVSKGNFLFT